MEMKTDFVSVNELSFTINRHQIIDHIAFGIAQGEVVAIVGANGSGKSTLLRLLANVLKPSAGEIHIEASLGYAPDKPPLYANDTVFSYLQFIACLKNIPKKDIAQRITHVLDTFALHEVSRTPIYKLSKGTQQRVNLAQAILNKPQLLLLDEPSDALDSIQCTNFVNYLKILRQQQVTIIIASHNYNEIIPICDYMFKINGGKLDKILLPAATTQTVSNYDNIHTPA